MSGKWITNTMVTVVLGSIILMSACSATGGVSQADYDAVKTQLADLQKQLNPEPREPGHLEARITIVMNEEAGGNTMYFATPEGVKGGPFRVPSGKVVGIHFINKSASEEHEILFGRNPQIGNNETTDYTVNLFKELGADVFTYPSGKKVEVATEAELLELELEPGADLWVRATFPAEMKGEWEIGCFVAPDQQGAKNHYDRGMHGKFIIE